jgi:hypothetical protein
MLVWKVFRARIIRWVAWKSRLAEKDGWTMRTPQPEQVHRLCAFSNLFTSL